LLCLSARATGWLLIGDQYQLPPYRFHDYSAAIANLGAVVAALDALPSASTSLVDRDWIRWWRDLDDRERDRFDAYVHDWLKAFERIYLQCEDAVSGQAGEGDRGPQRAARMITGQHRMHPDIGDLISQTYYKGELTNETLVDGKPSDKVRHPFTAPEAVTSRAVVWLDVPSYAEGGARECGGRGDGPRYTNPVEVDALSRFLSSLRRWGDQTISLAVLSPYNRQVGLLNERLRPELPDGVTLKQALRRRRANEPATRIAHTVDSFQGNQAGVIAVSLVRNNDEPPGKGLGFLQEAPRMNVLLSRAERMLVLVGSFDFFRHQCSLVDLEDTSHPLWHWKRVVTTLEAWFDEGRAVRLPAEVGSVA
jgi:superfamily I DNA and/or RNA helicase